jgi:hypothetical protein
LFFGFLRLSRLSLLTLVAFSVRRSPDAHARLTLAFDCWRHRATRNRSFVSGPRRIEVSVGSRFFDWRREAPCFAGSFAFSAL